MIASNEKTGKKVDFAKSVSHLFDNYGLHSLAVEIAAMNQTTGKAA